MQETRVTDNYFSFIYNKYQEKREKIFGKSMTSWESGSVEFNGTPICRTRGTGSTAHGIRRGQLGQARELTHMETNREND